MTSLIETVACPVTPNNKHGYIALYTLNSLVRLLNEIYITIDNKHNA